MESIKFLGSNNKLVRKRDWNNSNISKNILYIILTTFVKGILVLVLIIPLILIMTMTVMKSLGWKPPSNHKSVIYFDRITLQYDLINSGWRQTMVDCFALYLLDRKKQIFFLIFIFMTVFQNYFSLYILHLTSLMGMG